MAVVILNQFYSCFVGESTFSVGIFLVDNKLGRSRSCETFAALCTNGSALDICIRFDEIDGEFTEETLREFYSVGTFAVVFLIGHQGVENLGSAILSDTYRIKFEEFLHCDPNLGHLSSFGISGKLSTEFGAINKVDDSSITIGDRSLHFFFRGFPLAGDNGVRRRSSPEGYHPLEDSRHKVGSAVCDKLVRVSNDRFVISQCNLVEPVVLLSTLHLSRASRVVFFGCAA
jgi:hypothetical protein